MEDQLIDQIDEIGLWDSQLPHYIFPQIHRAPEFVRKCHESYDPNQRAIISPIGEILCSINSDSIEKNCRPLLLHQLILFPMKA